MAEDIAPPMPYLQPLASPPPLAPAGYVAFIDEAGDDGLQRIRTPNVRGASEWFVLSAVLVRIERESETVEWIRRIIALINRHQMTHLHFRSLGNDRTKAEVCEFLATLPLRIFSIISHKRNMEGYVNNKAALARVNRSAWFYCWCARLLLERISSYCARRSVSDFGEKRPVRFEFSSRGGVRLDEVRDYFSYLRDQSAMGMMYNKWGNLDWSVVDIRHIVEFPNKARAGLQLADCAAGAFFHALELNASGSVNAKFAKLLAPRVARDAHGNRFNYGLKMIPLSALAKLPRSQAEIFEYYRALSR